MSSQFCTKLAIKSREAAVLCGFSLTTWYALKATGRLGPQESRVGRAVLYSCPEVVEWAAAGFPPRDKWLAMKTAKQR
jgi:predicted DNA-binding transcriptional regulator AlpA